MSISIDTDRRVSAAQRALTARGVFDQDHSGVSVLRLGPDSRVGRAAAREDAGAGPVGAIAIGRPDPAHPRSPGAPEAPADAVGSPHTRTLREATR